MRLLQAIQRPTDLSEDHFRALGINVHTDASAQDVIPDPAFLPSATSWLDMTVDEAAAKDPDFRRQLSNKKLSPEARVFLERQQELATDNQAAFRTVRRMRPDPGKSPARLGNAYEFFRQLELMATYWDDTSLPTIPATSGTPEEDQTAGDDVEPPPLPDRPKPTSEEAHVETAGDIPDAAPAPEAPEAESQPQDVPTAEPGQTLDPKNYRVTYRTAPGAIMPAELRHSLITAFVKLVSYDFGCNPAPPKVEPRLHLLEPSSPALHIQGTTHPKSLQASYFPSGCVFLWRTPTQREAARAGVTEGPLLAISARGTTNFSTPMDHRIDFARELIAALSTAQLRAREGKEEKRFGDGQWWANEKRWGGGEGGPIGREEDRDNSITGDKDDSPGSDGEGTTTSASPTKETATENKESTSSAKSSSRPLSTMFASPSGFPVRVPLSGGSKPGSGETPNSGPPIPKRSRKNFSVYDNYRRIRPPTSNWDKRSRYLAIGKQKGSGFDDVFVVSSVFHHISLLRVRVPERLLGVLGGETQQMTEGSSKTVPEWGGLEMWRSQWFDLFLVEDRLEALRLIWGMTAWTMRDDENDTDVAMKGT